MKRVLLGYKKIKMFDILLADGNVVNESNYISGTPASGIVFLIENNQAHIIALSNVSNGNAYYGPNSAVGNGITSTSDSNIASNDYYGRKNMDAVITSGRLSNSPAFNLCNNFSSGIRGRGEWYLPALGEMKCIVSNIGSIELLLSKIGGSVLSGNTYWSSTEYSSTDGWWIERNLTLNHYAKTATWTPGYVRPVTIIRATY